MSIEDRILELKQIRDKALVMQDQQREQAQQRSAEINRMFQEMRDRHIEERSPMAAAFHERLRELIGAFEAELDEEHEVGVRLVSFGQPFTFRLKEVAYNDSSLITFSGHTTEDEPVELILHVSQISVLLQQVKRLHPDEPKQPIGFGGILQGENAQGENAQGENAQGENAQGENAQGENAQGENAQGEDEDSGEAITSPK